MAHRLERILLDLLRAETSPQCRCGEPIRPEDRIVILMGEECDQPGAGTPKCCACGLPLHGLEDVVVTELLGAERTVATDSRGHSRRRC